MSLNQVRSFQMSWVRPAQLSSAESHAPATGTILFAALLSITMIAQIILALLGADPLAGDFGLRSEIWSWSNPTGYIRTVTYALLHINGPHFVGNAVLLLLVGSVVEWRLGVRVVGPLLLAGAVVGAFVHLLMFPTEARPLVGASGAISTLFGAAYIVAGGVGIRVRLPFRAYWFSLTLRRLVSLWLVLQVAGLLIVYLDPSRPAGIAYWTHLAGFSVGLIAGAILWKQRESLGLPVLGEAYSIAGD